MRPEVGSYGASNSSYLCFEPKELDLDLAGCVMRGVGKRKISPGFDALARLSYYNLLRFGGETKPLYPFSSSRLLAAEIRAMKDLPTPTIGIELEIPMKFVEEWGYGCYSDLHGYLLCNDPHWSFHEFQLPYSYSWSTQGAMLRALLRMGYIPTFRRNTPGLFPEIVGLPQQEVFSLHCNLGVPKWSRYSRYGWWNVHSGDGYKRDVRLLSIASGLAFSSKERLLSRKTSQSYTVCKKSEGSSKGFDRGCRVELRALGFGNEHSYGQLAVLQDLGTALFASYLSGCPKFLRARVDALSLVWKEFVGSVEESLPGSLDGFDAVFNLPFYMGELGRILDETNLQRDMLLRCRHFGFRVRSTSKMLP